MKLKNEAVLKATAVYRGARSNEISSRRESMSAIPPVDCVITKPSLDYETIRHMVRGGDPFDVLL